MPSLRHSPLFGMPWGYYLLVVAAIGLVAIVVYLVKGGVRWTSRQESFA